MLPTAHIATALAFNRVTGLGADVAPAVAGALLPDAIDKTLAWVLGVAPAARHIGHTPVAALAFAGFASTVLGRRWGAAFAASYVTHLFGDLWHGGHVPWLMPFKKYAVRGERWHVECSPDVLVLEAAAALAIVLLVKTGPKTSAV